MLRAFAALSLMLLSACGGASTGPLVQTSQDTGVVRSYTSGLDFVVSRLERSDPLDTTAPNDLQATGSASYTGAMFLGSRTNAFVLDAVVGDMTLDFDLKDNRFDGRATDFVGRDGTNRAGTMQIANGRITRADQSISVTADVTGSVVFNKTTGASDDPVVTELRGDMSGRFYGDDANRVVGDVNVAYDIEPITAGGLTFSELPLEGYFAADAD